MRKIKVLQITEAAEGGVLRHLSYLLSHLNQEHFELHLILSDRRCGVSEDIEALGKIGITVSILRMSRNINLWRDLVSIWQLGRHFCFNKYDVVHAHSSKAGALVRILSVIFNRHRVYYTPHCFYFQGHTGFFKSVFVFIERILAHFCCGIVVSDKEAIVAAQNRIAPDVKIININNAIHLDAVKQSQCLEKIKARFGLGVDDIVVGSVGRLVRQKDWSTFVHAAAEVVKDYPKTKFLIVGDGEMKDNIQQLVNNLRVADNVKLLGHVKDIHNVYSIMDVFVSTSLFDGLPYVFLEAMNHSLPIVATNHENSSLVLDNVTGFVTPVRDYEAIGERIKLLIGNYRMKLRMGNAGGIHLRHNYPFDLFIRKHEELYFSE